MCDSEHQPLLANTSNRSSSGKSNRYSNRITGFKQKLWCCKYRKRIALKKVHFVILTQPNFPYSY